MSGEAGSSSVELVAGAHRAAAPRSLGQPGRFSLNPTSRRVRADSTESRRVLSRPSPSSTTRQRRFDRPRTGNLGSKSPSEYRGVARSSISVRRAGSPNGPLGVATLARAARTLATPTTLCVSRWAGTFPDNISSRERAHSTLTHDTRVYIHARTRIHTHTTGKH